MKKADAKPSFVWQGALILAPVVVLAVLAWIFLQRDRARTDDEARQRARELALQLAAALPAKIASRLADFNTAGQGWYSYHQEARALWPGSKDAANASTNRSWYEARAPDYLNALGSNRWTDVWPVNVSFSGS